MSDAGSVADVLAERPDLEEPLEAVLVVDRREETWAFDDVSIESGPFGELVSRGVVESVGDEYRLANPTATERALESGSTAETSESASSVATRRVSGDVVPSVSAFRGAGLTTWGLVAAAIAFVGLVRIHPIARIYPNGDVVLSGNDPYHYRYWVERALTEGGVPEQVLEGEPLLVATLATAAEVLGGSVSAASHVLAWYPVVSAVLSGLIVYLLATAVTEDRRIGLAAVLVLAIVPGHALRTSIGYADHHAFDYVWLGVTALVVTKLASVDREGLTEWRTWLLTATAGLAIAGQVLAWEAGPLLVAPLGAIVAGRAALDVNRGDSPLPAGLPVVASLAVGTTLAVAVHGLAGFQSMAIVLAPLGLTAGSAVALGVALGVRRLGWDVRRLLVGYVVALAGVLLTLAVVLTPVWDLFVDRLDALFRSDAIAETQTLFDSFGFLFLFGFALVLAIPAMVVGLRRSLDDGRWLALTAYAWYFLALATLQVRFVGELGTFAAVFAGIGFVWAASWIDAIPSTDGVSDGLAPLRVPNRRVLGTLLALMVLFGGFGALQVGVKTSQVLVEDDAYESATFVEDHAEDRGLTYPENYVLSDWGDNRAYNYFVNGESGSYGYAFRNYQDFVTGTNPDSWYDQFDGRVGYVVLHRAEADSARQSTLWKLSRNHGSADGDVAGAGHYRTVSVPDGESRTVVAVVPGANVTGTGEPGAEVAVSTSVDAAGVSFDYERRSTVDESDNWSVLVANPGSYDVSVGDGSTSVDVSEGAVEDGERVRVE